MVQVLCLGLVGTAVVRGECLYARDLDILRRPSAITVSLDWTSRLDWWTGLVDWTGGLTLKIIFMLSNKTHSPVKLCGNTAALSTCMVLEQITHLWPIVFVRVFVPSV